MIQLTIPTLNEQLNVIYNSLSQCKENAFFIKKVEYNNKITKTIFLGDSNDKWGAKWEFKDGFPFMLEFYMGININDFNSETFLNMFNDLYNASKLNDINKYLRTLESKKVVCKEEKKIK